MTRALAWLDERRETYLLGLARVAFALLYAHGAFKLVRSTLTNGYFGDSFHIPIVPESWVPSRSVYIALLSVQIFAALLAAFGAFARPLLLGAASIGLYLLCCNRLDYHNNRYVLHLMVFLLAFTPCDRSFRAFGPKFDLERRRALIWAQRLMQIQISLVYIASAGSKLVDADWRGGQVLLLRYQNIIKWWIERGRPLPEPAVNALSSPVFADLTSKAAIGTELFVAFGLWFARTRPFAIWLGVLLHLGIELGASVEIFSFLMWASYLLFCVPELRERKLIYDPARSFSRAFARGLAWFDWLLRFEREGSARAQNKRWGISAIDRDGTVSEGFGALVLTARAVPALFLLWIPLSIVHRTIGRFRPAR
ncbi:MAG TPA: HTTM domain-containing protein [Polyangiaceae bacterium]|nr:HTTM domain-containing protein [Polyangiaceae bacterium]